MGKRKRWRLVPLAIGGHARSASAPQGAEKAACSLRPHEGDFEGQFRLVFPGPGRGKGRGSQSMPPPKGKGKDTGKGKPARRPPPSLYSPYPGAAQPGPHHSPLSLPLSSLSAPSGADGPTRPSRGVKSHSGSRVFAPPPKEELPERETSPNKLRDTPLGRHTPQIGSGQTGARGRCRGALARFSLGMRSPSLARVSRGVRATFPGRMGCNSSLPASRPEVTLFAAPGFPLAPLVTNISVERFASRNERGRSLAGYRSLSARYISATGEIVD